MRHRRNKRIFRNDLLDNLQIVSKILFVLIIICLCIFINSSINLKKSINIAKSEIVENSVIDNTENEANALNTDIVNNTTSQNLGALNQNDNPLVTTTPRDTTINMAFTGDIMCHNTIYNDALDSLTNDYNFSYIFENIKYHIQIADIAVGNLETTFAGKSKEYSSNSRFNAPEDLAYNLKKVGFDVLTTANNHCFDYGYDGLASTINYLDEADIAHTGTFKSEADKNNILIRNVKGIKIAFLSFTYGTNGISVPSDKSYSVNLIDEQNILSQISLAKEQSPDLICVSMHWGTEYETKANSEQTGLADLLLKNGVDIIIGNHPHVLQPMEKREITLDDGSVKSGFVVYSLGNFLADQTKKYTNDSAILNLNITKSLDGKININSASYVPTYIYKDKSASSEKFKILDLKNVIASIEAGYETGDLKNQYNVFKSELDNIKNLIGNEIK